MSRQPHSRERICDALESCRPGSDDLHAPELADIADQVARHPHWKENYERIQKTDAKITAAYQKVPIPEGLQERLIASLHLAQSQAEFSTVLTTAAEGEVDNPLPADSLTSAAAVPIATKIRKFSRRWLLLSGGILTTAAAIFLIVFLGMNNSGGYTKETVQAEAIGFFNNDNPTTPGKLLTNSSYPEEFPLSNAIRHPNGIRWRCLANFLGKEAVAYDLPSPRGSVATLYVVKRTIPNLLDSPTLNPSNTGGRCVAAWQENGLLYVLVVKGSQKSYEEYLAPRGPVA